MHHVIDVLVFISLEINTYPRRIRRSSNLGHIFWGGKSASYRPENTVISWYHIHLKKETNPFAKCSGLHKQNK
jgi:hypothetical protein